MDSYQNLALLQNLYRLKALGFEYIDPFSVNENSTNEKPLNISQLYQNISLCHLCDLSKSRSQSMGGYGSKDADIMFVDYSVSLNDDKQNSYYTGRSGDTLKKMIENVLNLTVEDVFYTHAIKCKPLNSNKPSSSEWESCKNYLFTQIEFIKPKVIVALGEDAYNKLMGVEDGFESVRGHVIEFNNSKLIPIYHPGYLLRNPDHKKTSYNDLITIRNCL